jgi:transposase
LLQALRRKDRDLEETRRRLDALLRPRPTPVNPDQPSLFPEPEADSSAPPASTPVAEKPVSRRGQCKPHGRSRLPRELRREPKRHELTAAERLCPDCGQERSEIGVETTEQYEYKPAEVFVVEHQQVKYACPCCQGRVTLAPKPPQPIDKGLPGPGLLAHIIDDKYRYHIPLHRSENRLVHLGAPVSRSTMCDWMAASAELMMPLYVLLKGHVLQAKVVHTDDTTVSLRPALGLHPS